MPPAPGRSVATTFALLASLLGACSLSDRNPSETSGYGRPAAAPVGSIAPAPSAPEPFDADPHGPERPLLDRDIDWQANLTMRTLGDIASSLTHSEYSHGLRVNAKQGVYVFDCSSMAQWVLKRAAPLAEKSVSRGLGWRPLAADFQRRIGAVKPGDERGGWRRVARVAEAEPGDVIAWLKPKVIESKNTGHVAFVALRPARVRGYSDAYLVRVIDATSLLHDDDTRAGRSGFGMGTILLVVDPETGAPRAYGWVGLHWRAFETPISIGRPLR